MQPQIEPLNEQSLGKPVRPQQAQLSQYFTAANIARFMAERFDLDVRAAFGNRNRETYHLLDAGAGIGALSTAFCDRCLHEHISIERIHLDAFEIDAALHPHLQHNLQRYRDNLNLHLKLHNSDFIHAAADWLSGNLFASPLPQYSHAILNPPYRKIRSDSRHRKALREVGIETPNLYSGFLALALLLLADGGQLVAIVPRSFCNGTYYRPFRHFLLQHAAIRQIHLFQSRRQAFKQDGVLQENIIIHLQRGVPQADVTISTSTDDRFDDLAQQIYTRDRIVSTTDPERFIRIPTLTDDDPLENAPSIRHTLADLDLQVSTGPVVDFRLKSHLRSQPETDTVPLLYPLHFDNGRTRWPQRDIKKANAIQHNEQTQKWLYPNGYYCVVRRFSSKEEKRRIVASVVEPTAFPEASWLGLENHLNVFHAQKQGLPRSLAWGLSVFLNTTVLDRHFRHFSGHTQVNVTDLKQIRYPSRDVLIKLGEWAMQTEDLTQTTVDKMFARLTD